MIETTDTNQWSNLTSTPKVVSKIVLARHKNVKNNNYVFSTHTVNHRV